MLGSTESKVILAFITLATIRATLFLPGLSTRDSIPPITALAVRLLLAFMLLSIVMIVVTSRAPQLQAHINNLLVCSMMVNFAILGVLNVVVPSILIPICINHVNTGIAIVIFGTTPVLTQIFANYLIPKERRTSMHRICGLILGILGVALVSLDTVLTEKVDTSVLSYLGLCVATICRAGAVVFTARRFNGIEFLPVAYGQTVFATIIVILCSIGFDISFPPDTFPKNYGFFKAVGTEAIWIILYSGIVASGLAYLAQFFLIQTIGCVRTQLTDFLLTAIVLVEFFIDDPSVWTELPWYQLIGSVIGLICLVASIVLPNMYSDDWYYQQSQDRNRNSSVQNPSRPQSVFTVGVLQDSKGPYHDFLDFQARRSTKTESFQRLNTGSNRWVSTDDSL